MNQRGRGRRGALYTENRAAGARRADEAVYIYGNTARALEPQRQFDEPIRRQNVDARKNREKAHHMNAGYVLFLVSALVASAMILVNYLQLQADLTNLSRSVVTRQSSLNKLRSENDEEYNRIVRSLDLEEIKRVAMGELGMTYAQEGQIIVYEGGRYDYMRKVTESSR